MLSPDLGPESMIPVIVVGSWLSELIKWGPKAMIAAIQKWLKKISS